ncbi:Saposin B-type domain-containing protein [Caenorhabditis elegans]|uniref:Saposin B-type domain-containing protein n=1 Tax=Caenorhabditis elegans TaxID=6239 RepID=Q7YTP3_CAEEL|nr:Saposin B-type domain-containing protein [Caenorhabditis elegans]CAE17782.1 Saposin B-type domain-containing protein [Caenorhabditis elegans]|eukprot:NP_001021429.1 Uncharacterized protein CELE_F30A10.11 [Caenorhabditis elegans]
MKLLFVFLFISALVIGSDAQLGNLCMFCSGLIQVPDNWNDAQSLLRTGCAQSGDAASACIGLVNAADLTSSYPKMYPFIMDIKKMACFKFC